MAIATDVEEPHFVARIVQQKKKADARLLQRTTEAIIDHCLPKSFRR